MYGGSMFARSAALDTPQGRAIHAINLKWGDAPPPHAANRPAGRETIGIPVCKKKYKPFQFRATTAPPPPRSDSKHGAAPAAAAVVVQVERLYACQCHHPLRKAVIEQHGVRRGWQPFGVWSLRKAQEQARLETMRLSRRRRKRSDATEGESTDTDHHSGTDELSTAVGATAETRKSLTSICLNGGCTWKQEAAYDDIYKEMHGHTESEAEDNA